MRRWRVDVRFCALYQKWNSSSTSPLESPAVFPASFYCPLSLPPLTTCLSIHCLIFFLSPVFAVFPPVCIIFLLRSRFLSALFDYPLPPCFISASPQSFFINTSLTFSDSSCLSVSSLYLCLYAGRQAHRRDPLPLCSLLSPGQAAVMVPNALLIPVTFQNIPANAHMGTFTETNQTKLMLLSIGYVIVYSHLQACKVGRANACQHTDT